MLAFFALAATILSTGKQIYEQKKSVKAQQRAQRLEQRRQEIAAARERRQQVAMARRAQAQARAEAAGTGMTGSAVQGSLASIESQARSNIGFSTSREASAGMIGFEMNRAAGAEGRAATAGAVAGFSSKFANFETAGRDLANPPDANVEWGQPVG